MSSTLVPTGGMRDALSAWMRLETMLVEGEPGTINLAPVMPRSPFCGATLQLLVFLKLSA